MTLRDDGMLDYGQKPGIAEPFRFDVDGGYITYNHPRDVWLVVCDDFMNQANRVEINASTYKTIREFKAWAQKLINNP